MKHILLIILSMLSCVANAGQTQRLYLSGTDAGHTKTWDFYCSAGQNSGKWGKIQVPCSWELQGYGAYTYGRFYKTKGLKASDETGRYRTTFTTPKSWQGKAMRLTFEGSMTDTQVWVDGKCVNTLLLEGKNTGKSVHQGGFMEFSYDITPFITPGKKQTIEVLVAKESANKSVNSAERRADWWLFGGIYRPVYIEAMPQQHIENLKVFAKADGNIEARMDITHCNSQPSVVLSVKDKNGKSIPVKQEEAKILRKDNDVVTMSITADALDVKTWDPEQPHLYDFTFALADGSHEVTERIGFRTIEVKKHDGIYLNGTKLLVKGTNRHCFWPETGRAVSKAQSLMDAKIIKGMNMNAVRCHYPSDRHFLDACDSIGLLYLDEFPGWQTHYDDTTAIRLVQEFMARDVNRTCVFLWSNGNEGGWNTCVDSYFKNDVYDPQKRGDVHPWSDFDGIDTHHYPAYQTGTYRLQNGDNIFMPTEFLHSKYDKGAGSALEDMWGHWTKSPLFAGGFLWAYVDEAVRRTDTSPNPSQGGGNRQWKKGIKNSPSGSWGAFLLDSDGGNGPDGCMDPYRQPEASVSTIREIWSPVYIDKLNLTDVKRGKIPVENHYLFSDFSECSMRYKLMDGNGKSVKEGDVSLPEIAPGERGTIHFELPEDANKAEILQFVAYNKDGGEICSWSTPLERADEGLEKIMESVSRGKANVVFSDNGNVTISFPQNGEEGTFEGPYFVGMNAECYKHKTYKTADSILVHTYYYKGAVDSIRWLQTPNGLLCMDATILNDERGHGYKGDLFTDEAKWQLGISFKYPESQVDSIKWLGCGPYRVWRNRLKGQQFGLWSKAYNNTVTGQYNSTECPVYPEFKGYYANVRWMDFIKKTPQAPRKGGCEKPTKNASVCDKGHILRIYSLTENLYYRVFTPEEAVDQTPGEMGGLQETSRNSSQGGAKKAERTMVKFPEGDISFLLSIPPMQSYKPLEQLGPQSQPDNIRIKAGDEGFHIRLIFQQ